MENETGKQRSKTQTEYSRRISVKATRKLEAKNSGENKVWVGLGMMGMIGWSVVLPTLLGVALGSWIDRKYHSSYSWTLMMLVLGLLIGCLNAWHWVMRESRKHEK